jgi:putative DNA methylase
MTSPYRKKLIEVALPLAKINEAAAREKSIRHGHPSTLHLWWARRPLAACRAVLFASLVDDPDSDPAYRKRDGSLDEERAGLKRKELFDLIEDLVLWENSNNPRVINQARAEIARCVASRKIDTGELAKDTIIFGQLKGKKHLKGPVSGEGLTAWEVLLMQASPEVVNGFLAEYAPPVLDPFCGGGSIPLEAQRLGLRAYASDLNPVAVLITKALIEIPPKFSGRPPVNPVWQKKSPEEKAAKVWSGAQGLAEDVRYYGKWMRDEAEKRIGHLYPKVKITKEMAKDRPDLKEYVGEELKVIAWLWARTVASPNPVCKGTHVPLVKSFSLSVKAGKEAWIEPLIDRSNLSYRFTVRLGKGNVPAGTVGRNRGDRCLLSDEPITRDYIRNEGSSGHLATRLLAIVAEGKSGRLYLAPQSAHESSATGIPVPVKVPQNPIVGDTRYLTPTTYGMTKYTDLFTARQLTALWTFSDLIMEARQLLAANGNKLSMPKDIKGLADGGIGAVAYADAVATYLQFAVDKAADYWSNLCSWHSSRDIIRNTFGRQALSMAWDFAEANPWSDSTGNWLACIDWVSKVPERLVSSIPGQVEQLDATSPGVVKRPVFSTDPPYYDNVPYADLSDFFYIWIRRNLSSVYPQLLATMVTPKSRELVADPFRQGGKDAAKSFFESGMSAVFFRMREETATDFPTTIYYAFKQVEDDNDDEKSEQSSLARSSTGWETFLQGLTGAGWEIHGTWPIRTELGNRIRNMASNALASSVVLVCRARPIEAPLATRKQFITDLRQELPESLRNLQLANIAPVDLAQAAIGPGMAVFTRYAKVMETDGSAMTVRTALGLINQALDEVLAEQEGEFDGDTRWALAWFEQFGMDDGPFGVAETLSKAKNTAVNGLVDAGVIKARGGKVRLVKRSELPDDWDPTHEGRLTVWEATQHLIRALDKEGESGAAALLHKLGGVAETARDLAYRLYTLCERKKWAEEALAYNGMVIAWPELTKLALAERTKSPAVQSEMF